MLAVLAVFAFTTALHAQSAPCGLTSMTETTTLVYPPIAKVAHVYGPVILLARFNTDGGVATVHVVSGPFMLQKVATDFVLGWHVNQFTGPRECPIVVEFQLDATHECDLNYKPPVPFERTDPQHFVVRGRVLGCCDPSVTITRKRRFLIF